MISPKFAAAESKKIYFLHQARKSLLISFPPFPQQGVLAELVSRAAVLSPRAAHSRKSSAARLAASAGTASVLQQAFGKRAGNPNLWNISFIRDEARLQVWNPNLNLFPN